MEISIIVRLQEDISWVCFAMAGIVLSALLSPPGSLLKVVSGSGSSNTTSDEVCVPECHGQLHKRIPPDIFKRVALEPIKSQV